jgi:hypothetical protein
MTTPPVNHFHRGKIFYPLVVNYVVQLAGFRDVLFAGLFGRETIDQLKQRMPPLTLPVQPDLEQARVKMLEEMKNLRGPMPLRSEFQGAPIEIDVDELCREVHGNHVYLMAHLLLAAGSILILADAVTRGQDWRDRGPLWEFLRHCRNAAAHGGKFHFQNDEPKLPAAWGRFVISPQLQGSSLFKGADGVGMLSPGDPIRLLWDIEQAYPQMVPGVAT